MNIETTRHVLVPLLGRPAKHNYEALREEIQQLINDGYGIARLSRKYGLSYKWMKHKLAEMGLKTLWQQAKEAA
jgi:hypothetical protein